MEPYNTLLEKYPERRKEVADLGAKILNGEEVMDEDIINLFREEDNNETMEL
jgi:hypothetical protein